MISQFQQKEIKKYEDSIKELKKQRDDANFALQHDLERKDRLISDIGSLEKTKKDTIHSIDSLKNEVQKLESIIETRELCRVDVIKRHSESVFDIKEKEKELKTELANIEKEIKSRKKELEKIPKQEDILDNLNKDIESGIRELNLIVQNTLIEQDKFNRFIKEKDKKEKEVDKKIEKLSKLNIEVEEKMGTLQVYVQRLQGYYDESGVKLNILKEFNLKNL